MESGHSYTAAEARERFAEIINQARFGSDRVIITRHGKGVAAVVPLSDVELLDAIEDLIDIEEAREAIAQAGDRATIALRELKKDLDL